MPEQLIAYARHAIIRVPGKPADVTPKEADHLDKIFMIVRSQKGHDFSHYKKNTVLRRIERRMAVNRITETLSIRTLCPGATGRSGNPVQRSSHRGHQFLSGQGGFRSLERKSDPKIVRKQERRSLNTDMGSW